MKVTLESTTRIVTVNGVPGRVWEGETDSGVRCYAVVTRIAVHKDDDARQFEAELQECKPPSQRAIDAIPLRLVL